MDGLESAVPTAAAAAFAVDGHNEAAAAPHPPPIPTPTTTVATTSNSSGGGGGGGALCLPMTNNDLDDEHDTTEDDDDDMLLVTEFPPPPYYYALASRQQNATATTTTTTDDGTSVGEVLLTPPEIPHRAFRVAAKKARMEHQRRKLLEEEERRRALQLSVSEGVDASKGGVIPTHTKSPMEEDVEDDDSIDVDNPNEPLVAVFGEIVEDPTLFQGHADDDKKEEEQCHDPAIIRENVKRLNSDVLHGFLALVRKLAEDDPSDHRKLRDELSHNLFLMLQECNKFREHQAREILIDTLELQLQRRTLGLELLKERIRSADDALEGLQKFREAS
ncbi:hypothetical protein ACHAWU_004511 [Discostella pseudostelligera]|uniref:Mediator of RNA polymerase II transcription subunit 7 n=1 Tax=Discostella pseudostelligera TaxID=259834 RepID=A0ABD3MSY3_9STRA